MVGAESLTCSELGSAPVAGDERAVVELRKRHDRQCRRVGGSRGRLRWTSCAATTPRRSPSSACRGRFWPPSISLRPGSAGSTATAMPAQGPMQFMPESWGAFGDGDVRDPRDTILAAGRYLAAHGAPKDLRRAQFAYNRSDHYVDAVLAHAKALRRNAHYLDTNHRWRVYYRTDAGDVVLKEGCAAAAPSPDPTAPPERTASSGSRQRPPPNPAPGRTPHPGPSTSESASGPRVQAAAAIGTDPHDLGSRGPSSFADRRPFPPTRSPPRPSPTSASLRPHQRTHPTHTHVARTTQPKTGEPPVQPGIHLPYRPQLRASPCVPCGVTIAPPATPVPPVTYFPVSGTRGVR